MKKLNKMKLQELDINEAKKINGGSWWSVLIATIVDIIDNPEDFSSGYEAARSGGSN